MAVFSWAVIGAFAAAALLFFFRKLILPYLEAEEKLARIAEADLDARLQRAAEERVRERRIARACGEDIDVSMTYSVAPPSRGARLGSHGACLDERDSGASQVLGIRRAAR